MQCSVLKPHHIQPNLAYGRFGYVDNLSEAKKKIPVWIQCLDFILTMRQYQSVHYEQIRAMAIQV
eukprot:14373114-Ditylum_brightwellii.AAC.1